MHPSYLHRRHMLRQSLMLKYAYTSICTHPPTHICAHFLTLSPTKSPPSDTLKSLTFALLCTFTIATLTACMCSANTQQLLPCYHSHVCPHLPPRPHPHALTLTGTDTHACSSPILGFALTVRNRHSFRPLSHTCNHTTGTHTSAFPLHLTQLLVHRHSHTYILTQPH